MLVTEFDRLGDAGNRHVEWDLADGPVDGITLSEVEIVSDRHGDVSEDAPAANRSVADGKKTGPPPPRPEGNRPWSGSRPT
jgi:hypothetical protein